MSDSDAVTAIVKFKITIIDRQGILRTAFVYFVKDDYVDVTTVRQFAEQNTSFFGSAPQDVELVETFANPEAAKNDVDAHTGENYKDEALYIWPAMMVGPVEQDS